MLPGSTTAQENRIYKATVSCLCKGERPDLHWITQHEALPVPSTP
jgi:hypothetical protein